MSESSYFSDRESGPRPRTQEEISDAAWGGIVALFQSRLTDGSLGYKYPQQCQDEQGVYGTDTDALKLALGAEISEIEWPSENSKPPTVAILDFIEFCWRAIAKPNQGRLHSYFNHYHLTFDEEEGKRLFLEDVNRIFSRNGLAYELRNDGSVVRLTPEVLRQTLIPAIFQTGDKELDSMLETARTKYLKPDLAVRKEALEKLWDAWERLKTIENQGNKKYSTKKLLDRASSLPKFRDFIEKDTKALTGAGNDFQIRHSEVSQEQLSSSEQVDYLFHRLFALVRLLLRSSGRGG